MSTHASVSVANQYLSLHCSQSFKEIEDPAEEAYNARFFESHARVWLRLLLRHYDGMLLSLLQEAGLSPVSWDKSSWPVLSLSDQTAIEALSDADRASRQELIISIGPISIDAMSIPVTVISLRLRVAAIPRSLSVVSVRQSLTKLLSGYQPVLQGIIGQLVTDSYWYFAQTPAGQKLSLIGKDEGAFGYERRYMFYPNRSFAFELLDPLKTIEENELAGVFSEEESVFKYWLYGVWDYDEDSGQLHLQFPGETIPEADTIIKVLSYSLSAFDSSRVDLQPADR